jgi:hypothetical protein
MAVKPTELLLMPEELKRKSGTNDSKSISSEIKSLDSPNKSPSNSPRTANVWRKASFESPLLPNQEKRQSHSSNGIFFQGNFFWKELEKSAGGVQTLLVVGGTVWCGCIDGTLSIYEVRVWSFILSILPSCENNNTARYHYFLQAFILSCKQHDSGTCFLFL